MNQVWQAQSLSIDDSGEDSATIVFALDGGPHPIGDGVYERREDAVRVAHAHRLKLIGKFVEFPERYFCRYAHIHYTVKEVFWECFCFGAEERNKAGLFKYLRGLRERGASLNLEKELTGAQAAALCDMFCHNIVRVVPLNVL